VRDRRELVAGVAVIVLGAAAVLAGTLLGAGEGGGGAAFESWPPLVRAALVGASVAVGLVLLARAVTQIGAVLPAGAQFDSVGFRTMIRAVRLAFLAVAAFAMAGAWLVGSELLVVVAVVIAGVDVIETTFLLLVARTHRRDDGSGS
jgi:hypothetical protein